jgi:XRE family transcriptional regulator, regulator of sulfur utilization
MGENFRRLREAAGLSQSQLARAAGVPVGTYQQWEQGRRLPSLPGFIALADGLGVSLDALAGREAPKPVGGGRRQKAKGE